MALQLLKGAAESIKLHEQLKKEKRRHWLEKIKRQKEEKLIRLKEKKASQEDASCSSSEESVYENSKGKKVIIIGKERGTVGELKRKHTKISKEKENSEELQRKQSKQEAGFLDKDGGSGETIKKSKKKKTFNMQEVEEVERTKSGLTRLPDDLLEDLTGEVAAQMVSTNDEQMVKKKRKKHHHNEKPILQVATRSGVFHIQADIDYIPLEAQGATKFGVVPLEQIVKVPKTMAQVSADYKYNLLHGNRINRTPAKSLQAYKKKLKAAGKDRI